MKTDAIYCFVLSVILFTSSVQSDCRLITYSHFGIKSPLVIKNGVFVTPKRESSLTLKFTHDEHVDLYCPGRIFKHPSHDIGQDNLSVHCRRHDNFDTLNATYNFKDIQCSNYPVASTRVAGKCPFGELVEIGFQISKDNFMAVIRLCFNRKYARTTWAHSVVTGAIQGRQRIGEPPTFRTAGFFQKSIKISRIYSTGNQREQMLKIFAGNDSQTLLDKYMPIRGSHYFARSHMIARTDMYYTSMQFATFFYINTMPIWQMVNQGNWLLVEEKIRELASQHGDLEVWAGNMKVLSLPGHAGEPRDIYLANNDMGEKIFHVPKLLFKVAFHRRTNRAVVFITENNPYQTIVHPHEQLDYVGCKEHPSCRKNEPRFSDNTRGFTHCCTYKEFYQTVKEMGFPDLGDPAILE